MIPVSSARKQRLFGIACSRFVWHYLSKDQRDAIEVAEAFFHDKQQKVKYHAYRKCIEDDIRSVAEMSLPERLVASIHHYAAYNGSRDAAMTAGLIEVGLDQYTPCWAMQPNDLQAYYEITDRQEVIANVILKVIPWKPMPATLTWNNKTIPALANSNDCPYPVLADALEEAGETSVDVLTHLRTTNIRVKGDYVIDRILGKK